MIYDKLINMGLYKGMNKNLDTAIDFILSNNLNELPLGKTVVDGDNVYINVMDAKASPVEERAYEIHKNYMDIHYIEHYSFLEDIKLCAMTLKILFVRESTEGFSEKDSKLKNNK